MLNALDKQLIQFLEEDGRTSAEKLARRLGVSAATVRRRLERLKKDGLMQIVTVVHPSVLGFPVFAVIALDIAQDKLDSVMAALAACPEVRWVSTTTGRFDIVLLARFSSNGMLSDFVQGKLSKIEGIKDTETFLCLREGKGNLTRL